MTDQGLLEIEFAAILCSRLCHDLVSPVGAVTNGVELLREETDAEMRDQVQDLLMQSSQQASRKLQFYRLAFGSAAGFSESISLSEAQTAIRGLLEVERIEPVFKGEASSANKAVLKILLNLILLQAEALLRGGTLDIEAHTAPSADDAEPQSTDITLQSGDIDHFTLLGQGPKVVFSEKAQTVLMGADVSANLDPRVVPAALAARVAGAAGMKIEVSQADDRLEMVVTKTAR